MLELRASRQKTGAWKHHAPSYADSLAGRSAGSFDAERLSAAATNTADDDWGHPLLQT